MRGKTAGAFLTVLRHLSRTFLRIVVTGLIFTACLWIMSRYLGLPVPSPSELLDKVRDVSKLAEVLS